MVPFLLCYYENNIAVSETFLSGSSNNYGNLATLNHNSGFFFIILKLSTFGKFTYVANNVVY